MGSENKFIDLSKENLLELSNVLWEMSKEEYKEKYKYSAIKDILLYRRIHCKSVADLAEAMFNDNFNKECSEEEKKYLKNILYLAALTHDIRKLDKKHAISGARWMEKKLQGIRYSFNDEEGNLIEVPVVDDNTANLVCMLIEMHKSLKSVKINRTEEDINEDIKILILFLRMADKLSKPLLESSFRKINADEINIKVNEVMIKYTFAISEFNITEVVNSIVNSIIKKYCN
ncbi:MAG: hypothetical protein E7214_03610 [Clostridium sp.]|nr:hypothetical protein [Clostridium sp.]